MQSPRDERACLKGLKEVWSMRSGEEAGGDLPGFVSFVEELGLYPEGIGGSLAF